MMPRTPRAPQSSIMPHDHARRHDEHHQVDAAGSSPIDAQARTPQTASYFGLTGYSSPSNPTWRSDRSISGAQLSGDSDAPTIAIDRGASSGREVPARVITLVAAEPARPATRSPPSVPARS